MKKLLKIITAEEIIIVFLGLALLVCSYGPLAIQYLTPPPGKVFLGVFGFPPDFYGNLTNFQEGRAGLWQHLDKVSSTASGPPVWLKIEYRLLGWLSRFLPIDMTVSFHLSRFILSLILILVSYQLIKTAFKGKYQRISALLLAFFSTSFGIKDFKLMLFWTPISVFQRAAYFQHYLLSFIFILEAIIFLNQALVKNQWSRLMLAAVFGFLAGFIHAFSLISLFLTLPFYFLFDKNRSFKKTLFLATFCGISSLSLLYLFKIRQFPPWNLFSSIELTYNLIRSINLKDFILGIGPTSILALAGAYLVIKKPNNLSLLLAPWSFVYLIGFFFLWRLLGLNSVRFIQTPFYIILGILSVYPISNLTKSKPKNTLFITLFIVLLSLSTFPQSLKINRYGFVNQSSYASTNYLEALDWLARNSKEKNVFLSTETNGMIIAARSGPMPYLTTYSSGLETYYLLKANLQNFYSQTWSEKQALDFLKNEKVKYIFFGLEEKALSSQNQLNYSFLQKVFENLEATIYTSPSTWEVETP